MVGKNQLVSPELLQRQFASAGCSSGFSAGFPTHARVSSALTPGETARDGDHPAGDGTIPGLGIGAASGW